MRSLIRLLMAAVAMALPMISPAHAATIDLAGMMAQLQSTSAVSEISEADEIVLGRELAGRVLGAAPLIGDDALQKYVNSVGRWVASQSERADLTWHFGVVDASEFNAYAVPGGYVFITRALYDALEDEAQLAGVLAHAIASIVRRYHVTIPQKSAQVSALTSLTGAAMPRHEDLHAHVRRTGAEIFARGLDKTAVFEADHMALVLTARAGYSPDAFLEVLQTLHARRGSASDADVMFSTHPLPQKRLEKLYKVMTAPGQPLPAGKRPKLRRSANAHNEMQPNPSQRRELTR